MMCLGFLYPSSIQLSKKCTCDLLHHFMQILSICHGIVKPLILFVSFCPKIFQKNFILNCNAVQVLNKALKQLTLLILSVSFVSLFLCCISGLSNHFFFLRLYISVHDFKS